MEMNRREVVAWGLLLIFVIVCSVCVVAMTFRAPASSGLSATERKKIMEIADLFDRRLYQNVNAKAEVNTQFAGKGATASVNGNDAVGQINITTGASPAAGSLVHVTFVNPYKIQPILTVTPLDQSPPPDWFVTVDWYGFDIVVGSAPKPSTNYPFTYIIAPRPWSMYVGHKD